ncbi:hypothetical protein IRZ71_22795 [Flavobacterium sp. ANB]|uniref:hypothetical protein n=1 Tax=unclassified Flavobacterium TaxID=196869 RepID=UPI0012B90E84|nr:MULTISPECIES: hypothetical protein [unclassified Flavobacterium]MBF4519190.1 hypothetical protein [Flavobacterium sp. ANB]MTD72006.1 hypothetical protein [Flavobacterium sp. LC2016-13]
MKKFLPFFGALALLLTSCSSDDNNDDATASIKPSKIAYSYASSDSDYSLDIKYDGNKLISQTTDDGEVYKFTYTGDVITKVEFFNTNKQLQYTTEYVYTGGKLTSLTEKSNNEVLKKAVSTYSKTKYTYNADGTITAQRFYVYQDGTEQEQGSVIKITIKDSNYSKAETSYNSNLQYTTTYEYDSKNNPFKNITGFNLLIDWQTDASRNNVTKQTKVRPESQGKTSADTQVSTYSYIYDSNNFPTEQKSFNGEGTLTQTAKYTY